MAPIVTGKAYVLVLPTEVNEQAFADVGRPLHNDGDARMHRLSLLALLVALFPPAAVLGCKGPDVIAEPKVSEQLMAPSRIHPSPRAVVQRPTDPSLPDLRSLTMARAVDIAVARNPEVGALREQLQAALARIPEMKSLPDPMLNLTVFAEEIQTAAGQQELILAINQRIPWLEKLTEAGNVQAALAASIAAQLQDKVLEISDRTRQTYLELLYTDRSLARLRDLEGLVETQLIPDIREKVRVGQAGLESLYEAEAQLELLRNRIRALSGQRDALVAELLALMGLNEDAPLELAAASLPSYELPRRAELLAALHEHPLAVARAYASDCQRHRVRLADLDYVPDLTLGAQWSNIASRGISPVANGEDAAAVTVGLNLPIYLDRIEARRKAARAELAQSEELERATLLVVRSHLDASLSQLNARHAQRVRHEKEILPRVREAIEVGREAYRVDRISVEQYIQLWRELIEQEVQLYRLLTDEYKALSAVERWSGIPVFPSER